MSPKKQNPDAIAVQLIGTKHFGNYCAAYNLKDGSVWKRFKLPSAIYTYDDWTTIFKLLTKECPPNIVKSVFVNMSTNVFVKVPNYDGWFVQVKKQGIKYGYFNFCRSTNLVLRMVLELLETKRNGKKYQIGDCILLAEYMLLPPGKLYCEIHILKKQEIGWDVLDGKVAEMDKFLPEDFQHFIKRNGLMMHQVKDCFVRIVDVLLNNVSSLREFIPTVFSAGRLTIKPVIMENIFEFLEPPGEYLSKVYSGEDYFNDYDCFVGNICTEKCEVVCGPSTIVFPVLFKRLPVTIKKKIKFTKCEGFKVIVSCDHMFYFAPEDSRNVIFDADRSFDAEILLITFTVEQDKGYCIKIEKDNDERTLLVSNIPLNEWIDGRPRFFIGKDYCSVNYYKAGLLWKLKDVNGNDKIQFTMSFDEQIYIGEAAMDHPRFLLPNIDLEALLNDKNYHQLVKNGNFIKDVDKEYKILVQTRDGTWKTSPENVVAIFIKSILKLLEEKLEKPVDEIYLGDFIDHAKFKDSLVISKVMKILKIGFEVLK